MNLFFLMTGRDGAGEPFLRDASPLVSRDAVEVFKDLPSFAERLRRPKDPSCVVVILGPSDEELKRIAPLREYLRDSRILLVLRDQSQETIGLAHRVLPTYITYFDNGTSGVVSVIKHIMKDSCVREGER
jgi:hypothetical protein